MMYWNVFWGQNWGSSVSCRTPALWFKGFSRAAKIFLFHCRGHIRQPKNTQLARLNDSVDGLTMMWFNSYQAFTWMTSMFSQYMWVGTPYSTKYMLLYVLIWITEWVEIFAPIMFVNNRYNGTFSLVQEHVFQCLSVGPAFWPDWIGRSIWKTNLVACISKLGCDRAQPKSGNPNAMWG